MSVNELQALTQKFADAFDQRDLQPVAFLSEPEPGFRIVQPDGRVDLWTPPQPNGQEPPSS